MISRLLRLLENFEIDEILAKKQVFEQRNIFRKDIHALKSYEKITENVNLSFFCKISFSINLYIYEMLNRRR